MHDALPIIVREINAPNHYRLGTYNVCMPMRPPTFTKRLREHRGLPVRPTHWYRRRRANLKQREIDRIRWSRRWRRLRDSFIRNNPLCAACLAYDRVTPATEVDHVIRLRDRRDLAFDIDNLQALCKSCHSRKTMEENRCG